jgi:hypothetical protein
MFQQNTGGRRQNLASGNPSSKANADVARERGDFKDKTIPVFFFLRFGALGELERAIALNHFRGLCARTI